MKCFQTDGKMDDRQQVHVFSTVHELSSQFSKEGKKNFMDENMTVVVILHDDLIMLHKTSNVFVPSTDSDFNSIKNIIIMLYPYQMPPPKSNVVFRKCR